MALGVHDCCAAVLDLGILLQALDVRQRKANAAAKVHRGEFAGLAPTAEGHGCYLPPRGEFSRSEEGR